MSNCNGKTCSVQVAWQEKNRTTANEYKMVVYPVRPGKTGSYELLTFNNTTAATLTGFAQGVTYIIKVSAWPNGVFRRGYGIPYYQFTASPAVVSPTSTPISPTSTPDTSESPAPSSTQLVGDLNNDGVINILDYNILINCFGDKAGGPTCLHPEVADLNSDGVIDGIDYNIFLRAFLGAQQ